MNISRKLPHGLPPGDPRSIPTGLKDVAPHPSGGKSYTVDGLGFAIELVHNMRSSTRELIPVDWIGLSVALLVAGTIAWGYAWLAEAGVRERPEWVLRDWTQIWRGANALARGENPWAPLAVTGLPYPYRDRIAYPLPALWMARPVHDWSLNTIAFVWVLASITVAGVALARRNLWHVLALFSWPAVGAAALLQWSTLMVAAARFDVLVALAACKPNLGLVILAYRPTVRRVGIVAAVLVLSLIANPVWIWQWRDAAASLHYVPPVMIWQGGGPLLLLAALRWKLPDLNCGEAGGMWHVAVKCIDMP